MNTLYYGDNLKILRKYIKDESVDLDLDPFCGCGTTIAAAQKLNRQWIGIGVTHLSITLQKYRLKNAFGLEPEGRSLTVREGSNAQRSNPALPNGQASAFVAAQ